MNRKIKKSSDKLKQKYSKPKLIGHSKSRYKWEIYSDKHCIYIVRNKKDINKTT